MERPACFTSGSKGNQRESASGSGQSASGKMADKLEMLAWIMTICSDHQQCNMCGMYDDDELCTWGYPIGNTGRNVSVNCLHCVWVFESQFKGHPSFIACIEQLRPSTHHVTMCCL